MYSDFLKTSLHKLEGAEGIPKGRKNQGRPERNDDFDCTLCLKLLYEPVTTPCGHSFCRSCLLQTMDNSEGFFCNFFLVTFFVVDRVAKISLMYVNSSYVKSFMSKLLDNKCPLCRTVLFISPRTCAIRYNLFYVIVIARSFASVFL